MLGSGKVSGISSLISLATGDENNPAIVRKGLNSDCRSGNEFSGLLRVSVHASLLALWMSWFALVGVSELPIMNESCGARSCGGMSGVPIWAKLSLRIELIEV